MIINLVSGGFIFALGIAMLLIFYKMWSENRIENKTYFLILISVFAFGVAVNLVYVYIKNSRKISIDEERIKIAGKELPWSDIDDIKLGGKKGFGFFDYQLEAAELKFKTGEKYYIFENIYSNGDEIKYFIKKVIIEKNDNPSLRKPISERELTNESFHTYAGSPFFSFRGIMLWSLILFMAFLVISRGNKNPEKMWFLIPICISWFLLNAYSMHYFDVSRNFLIVRNHFFLWKKDIFRLTEIEELVFETQPKQANMLRVVSSDFKTRLYRAGTLSDATWRQLKEDLEKKNVLVRNECI